MAQKRQNIDNFFRENLSGFELSENKGNWELINQLLIEQERKNKKRKWLLFFFIFNLNIIIVILSSGLLILMPDAELKDNTNNTIEPSNTFTTTENNSFKNESYKSKTIPSNNDENTNSKSLHVIKSENYLIKSQPKIALNDSDKTVIQDIKSSEFFLIDHSQTGDSINSNTIAQEAVIQDSILPGIKSGSNDSISVLWENIPAVNKVLLKEAITAKTEFLNFNLYAGINIYNTCYAFKNQQNISPLFGLELMRQVSQKFAIGLSGMYSLQGGYHLNDTAIMETYFLDKNVSQQTIQIHQLHKLYFPLTFYYTIAKKHSVLGAFQASYLLNTNGNYTEMNKTSEGTFESQKNNVNGYMDGIKSKNLAISLGYKYRVSKRFDFSTRLTRELTESYTKGYFYGVNTKPSWSIQTFFILKF